MYNHYESARRDIFIVQKCLHTCISFLFPKQHWRRLGATSLIAEEKVMLEAISGTRPGHGAGQLRGEAST